MSLSSAARENLEIASRAAAAILGGYGFLWLMTPALTLLLPRMMNITLFDSLLAVTMSSFLVWAVLAMAVFHARSAVRAWTWLLMGCVASMSVLWLLTGRLLP